MKDYRAIFEAVESTLIREGSRILPEDELRSRLDKFKQLEGRKFTDPEVYRFLVEIAFYSGFRVLNAGLWRPWGQSPYLQDRRSVYGQ